MRPIYSLPMILILSALAVAQPATQPAVGADGANCAITIYSSADPRAFDPQQFAQQQKQNIYLKLPGYGVVREIRPLELKAGENVIRFTDVASGIDPTTVSIKSLTAPNGMSVLEQNYEYDLVSSDKLLEKYLDKQIVIVRKTDHIEGKLLSSDFGTLVIAGKDGGVQVIPRNEEITAIQLAELSAGLITKPTLVWKVETDQAGQHKTQVSYQTDGLTWRSDYTVVVNADDSAADVGAWVTILNQSGASYADAKLKLVAGDVQRIQPPQQIYPQSAQLMDRAAGMGGGGGFVEKSFFEYHLYTLGRTTTLGNNSTKQIELFPTRAAVPVNKTYVYYGLPNASAYYGGTYTDRDLGIQANKQVDIYIQIENAEKNGLGIPMPAGRVRVYKKDDADNSLEFIGEDAIQHTPKDEKILLKLGSAFDVVGERKQTNFTVDVNAKVMIESFEIALRNHKDAAVNVIVKENLYRSLNWEVTQSSDKWEKQDVRTIHIPIEVPANGEKKITYTVKYTW